MNNTTYNILKKSDSSKVSNTKSKSKSALFLLELIFVLLIFSVCSVICVGIFARTSVMTNGAEELHKAVFAVQNEIEAVKSGMIQLNETASESRFDSDFNVTSDEPSYIMTTSLNSTTANAQYFTVTFARSSGEVVYSLESAAFLNEREGA